MNGLASTTIERRTARFKMMKGEGLWLCGNKLCPVVLCTWIHREKWDNTVMQWINEPRPTVDSVIVIDALELANGWVWSKDRGCFVKPRRRDKPLVTNKTINIVQQKAYGGAVSDPRYDPDVLTESDLPKEFHCEVCGTYSIISKVSGDASA